MISMFVCGLRHLENPENSVGFLVEKWRSSPTTSRSGPVGVFLLSISNQAEKGVRIVKGSVGVVKSFWNDT